MSVRHRYDESIVSLAIFLSRDREWGWTLFCSGKPVGGPVSPNASRKGASQNRERDHAGCLNGCRREVHQKRRPQTAESLEVLARSKDTAAASLSLSLAGHGPSPSDLEWK